jgi:arylsulfatase A-like enzyme
MHDYFKEQDKVWGKVMDGRQPGKLDGYLTDVLADRAIDFIRRRQKAGGPWFTYLAFNAVHTPMQAPEPKLQEFASIPDKTRRTLAAMTSSLDDAIGRVLAAVREAGAEENTLIFFLSDNGGPLPGHAGANGALNTPLRGSKLEVWDGGIRVPFAMQWKGRIPSGKVVGGMISSLDIAATALAVAGADPSAGKPLDGLDLLPVVDGKPGAKRHEALFFEFISQRAARVGDWKWVEVPSRMAGAQKIDSGTGLFNIAEDIGETRDLSAEQPEKLAQIRAAFEKWSQSVSAESGRPASPPKRP